MGDNFKRWGVFEHTEDGVQVCPVIPQSDEIAEPHTLDVFCICGPIIDESGIIIHNEEQ